MSEDMNYIVLDIETIPDHDISKDLRPEVKLGNLKDKEKIEAKQAEWEENGQVKAMSVSTLMNKIVSIQMWSSKYDDFVKELQDLDNDEESMIKVFWDVVQSHDVVVGHNILGFDLPTILNRSMILGIEPTKIFNMPRYRNYPLYDTMQILAGWDSSKWKGLDWLCQRLGIEGKTHDGSKVYRLCQEGKIDEIHEYCRNDVRMTMELFHKIEPYYPIEEKWLKR
jgi:predicted PolB exonuclease-like 3'-5' exonuclease